MSRRSVRRRHRPRARMRRRGPDVARTRRQCPRPRAPAGPPYQRGLARPLLLHVCAGLRPTT
eukprot:scaffold323_cov414-Prasinococcus_capsulatus_cf.AAC.24